ncbi:MAG TPA: nucleotide exchange factor GrpE [Ignavibacteriaceae bacterium]|nr:nucleotide exchange factor GrpE [Ignavibacteriaceae bacterium]
MKKDKNDVKSKPNESEKDEQMDIKIKGVKEEENHSSAGSGNLEEVNKEKIEHLEKEIQEYKEKLLRKAAEFENYKRRTENDQLNLIKYAAETFIIKLLPTVDDLERSLKHIENAKDISAIKDGIKLVYDKLLKVLDDQGVKKIDSVGKPFDVHFHEALLQRKEENIPPHTVLDEVEKGYMYKDRVIRHTKVIVSDDSSGESGSDNNPAVNNSNIEDK